MRGYSVLALMVLMGFSGCYSYEPGMYGANMPPPYAPPPMYQSHPPAPRPRDRLTRVELETLLKEGVGEGVITTLVRERGIEYLTVQDIVLLKRAGANEGLLSSLVRPYRPAPPAYPRPSYAAPPIQPMYRQPIVQPVYAPMPGYGYGYNPLANGYRSMGYYPQQYYGGRGYYGGYGGHHRSWGTSYRGHHAPFRNSYRPAPFMPHRQFYRR